MKEEEAKEKIGFLMRFFEKRKQIASITPTSKKAAVRIADMLDFSRPVCVVEYGAGTGPVAEEIQKRMSPTSRLILVEIDEVFADQLRKKFVNDDRVAVIGDDIKNIQSILQRLHVEKVDVVLANIPLSLFSFEETERIITETHEILKADGVFLVFNFVQRVFPRIEAKFAKTTRKIIWNNIPPLSILFAKK